MPSSRATDWITHNTVPLHYGSYADMQSQFGDTEAGEWLKRLRTHYRDFSSDEWNYQIDTGFFMFANIKSPTTWTFRLPGLVGSFDGEGEADINVPDDQKANVLIFLGLTEKIDTTPWSLSGFLPIGGNPNVGDANHESTLLSEVLDWDSVATRAFEKSLKKAFYAAIDTDSGDFFDLLYCHTTEPEGTDKPHKLDRYREWIEKYDEAEEKRKEGTALEEATNSTATESASTYVAS